MPAPVIEQLLAGVTHEMETPDNNTSVGAILRDNLPWILGNEKFSQEQKKTAAMLAGCRTPAMGTYIDYCPQCKKVVGVRYCSCNNRNCPCCQYPMQLKWVQLRESEVIEGVPYFHIVLTLPHVMNPLVAANPKLLLGILFRSSSQAVIEMCMDPNRLGAKPGIISVLHTWTQDLRAHYHVHMICSAGGVNADGNFVVLKSMGINEPNGSSEADTDEELYEMESSECMSENDDCQADKKKNTSGFFLPLKALTSLFRGKYMAGLRSLYTQHKLRFPSSLDHLNDPEEWKMFCGKLYEAKWIGYLHSTFNGNGNAIEYLARYTFRTAISNSRIKAYDGKNVTFQVRDNEHPGNHILKELDVHEFITRFLAHVLPKGFTRVRFYGFLANGQKTKQLQRIFQQQNGRPFVKSPIEDLKGLPLMQYLLPNKGIGCCPCCNTPTESFHFNGDSGYLRNVCSRAAPAA